MSPRTPAKKVRKKLAKLPKPVEPTTIASIDALASISNCTLTSYIGAASDYVKQHASLTSGQKKSAQIRLSTALAHALAASLRHRLPQMGNVQAAETPVSGALRVARADVSEMDYLDGLRLAIEIKPVNLAIGRALWNRFGDIRSVAVNIHLKFPFAVVGGVLVIPTYEEMKRGRVSTVGLIERVVRRLVRAGGRRTEDDAPHRLEGVAVVAYDPDEGVLHPTIPSADSGLRWDDFITDIVSAYDSRFVANKEREAEVLTVPSDVDESVSDNQGEEPTSHLGASEAP